MTVLHRRGPTLLGVACAVWLASVQASAQESVRPRELSSVGDVRQGALAHGESQDWLVRLTASEYIELALQPLGILLTDPDEWPGVTVTGPGGGVDYDGFEPHVTLNIDIGARAIVSFVASTAGEHRVRVTARRQVPGPLPYSLRVNRRGPATEADRTRLVVHGQWREGARLFARGTREARLAALPRYEEALRLLVGLDDLEGQALTLSTMAAVYYGLSDAAHGRSLATRARDLWVRLGREGEEGAVVSDLGLFAYLAYDHPTARTQYEEALKKHRATGDVLGEATTLVRLGWAEFAAGDMSRVIDLNQQAIPMWRRLVNISGESVSRNDLGRAYAELGDITLALDAYRAALSTRPADIDPRGAAVTLMRIGQLHLSVADWPSAFDALEQALALTRRANDARSEASVLSNLGLAHSRVGDSDEAQRYLELALATARRASHRTVEGNALAGMGVEAYLRGDVARSRMLFEQALAVQTAISDVRGQATTLRYLASTQLAMNQPREALSSITQSLEKSQATGVSPSGLATLAAVHATLGNPSEANASYVRALERARHIRARDQEAAVLTLHARFLMGQGEYGQARQQLEQALEIHETLRGVLVDPDQRMSYTSRAMTPYELYIDVLTVLDRQSPGSGLADEAFRTAERARSRGLLDLLAASNIDLRRDVDRELVNRERSLRWRLNAKAAVQTSLLMTAPSSRRLAVLEAEIADLSRSWRETTTMMRRQSPAYAALTEPELLSAKEVRELLDPQTVLLEIAPGDAGSWLFAVTTSGLETYPLPPRQMIDEVARDVHRLLTARQPERGETAEARNRRVQRADQELSSRARELSALVLGPIATKLETEWRGRRLVVVPSGALEYVPMAVLPVPGRAAGDDVRLIARHETVVLPSASSLPLLRRASARRDLRRTTVAVVADPVFSADDPRVTRPSGREEASPTSAMTQEVRGSLARLPFSRAEAQAVASRIDPGVRLQATDFDASLELVTSGRLNDYRIVHFATHGVINTSRPELSGLALSLVDQEGRSRDGFLRLNTIYNLRLSADLVVLSACQSALGRQVAGEGLVGLTRGFMHAGARRVVASLWQVSDAATAELMKHFYEGMLERRLSAAAALRRAQRQMAADPRWAPPYFWAGFVLQGDWAQ